MHFARLVIDPPCSAERAMGVDAALLARAAETNSIVIRLYQWVRPTISLGCMQDAAILDMQAMAANGIGWIHRPTGGRAVLHHHDITYAVAFPAACTDLGTTLQETYLRIAGSLAAGLRLAGIVPSLHDAALNAQLVRREKKLPCFLAPSRSEIMTEGKKLFGSAQKRTRTAVLQHGSLPVTADFRALPRYCALSPQQRLLQQRELERTCSCARECVPDIDTPHLIECLARGFEHTFALTVQRSDWTPEEQRVFEHGSPFSATPHPAANP